MADKFYLTTPIYYVNARPHIGTTYTTVVADVIARRKRALGVDTFFLTGTDEHGQKIERSAERAGCTPQAFADEVSAQFRALWDRMGLTYDDFIRTTEPRHKIGVQKLFTLLKDRGYIYKGSYTGQYCVSDEAYVDVPPGAPCPECGRITETVNEENYFFKLSAFEHTLLEFYETHPEFIRPETRRNEVISFVRAGLKDLSISRTSFKWGIPVPGDEKHVIYVWMDALANYITALGWGSDDESKFNKYWPADLHIVGKEITRFHCVYWPAFLMAAGLPLPKSIVAHGWLLFEESKMSKSRGNIVRAETILEVLGDLKPELPKEEKDLFSTDVIRYFLLREIPFGQDGSFSFDALVQRYNSDLANGYGNLVSRTLTMIGKYFDGTLPAPHLHIDTREQGELGSRNGECMVMADLVRKFSGTSDVWDNTANIDILLFDAITFVGEIDRFLTATSPWKIAASSDESDRAVLATILFVATQAIRSATALLYPFLPYSTSKVWAALGLGDISKADLKNIAWGGLQPGTKLGELGPVFPRAEKDAIQRMKEIEEKNAPPAPVEEKPVKVDKPAAPAASEMKAAEPKKDEARHEAGGRAVPPAPAVPVTGTIVDPTREPAIVPGASAGDKITIDDFAKVELRVAQIKVAERIPKADKLLRLEVDLGYEQRQILAGIAEAYTPESLVGRKVVIVANLAPRKLRGLESNGMIVAASLEGGKPVLAGFLEDIEIGARLK